MKHKILAIVEEAGAEKASYALKLLQSEGELTIASTGKDPADRRMETQEYHVEGPVMILLTTTAIDLDEELQNRCLTLSVDESPEQTSESTRCSASAGRWRASLRTRNGRASALLRNAQRLLRPVEVLNPYAPSLTFTSGRTRNRRDHEKYLTLIDSIALLHQHQRPRGATSCRAGERLYRSPAGRHRAGERARPGSPRAAPSTSCRRRRAACGRIRELVQSERKENQGRAHL